MLNTWVCKWYLPRFTVPIPFTTHTILHILSLQRVCSTCLCVQMFLFLPRVQPTETFVLTNGLADYPCTPFTNAHSYSHVRVSHFCAEHLPLVGRSRTPRMPQGPTGPLRQKSLNQVCTKSRPQKALAGGTEGPCRPLKWRIHSWTS